MARRVIRRDHPDYELRGAEVRRARKARPCDSPLCARHDIVIGVGEEYAYINTGIAFCDFHYGRHDVVDADPLVTTDEGDE